MVNDADIWDKSWSAFIAWNKTGTLYEYACHEGNYSLRGMLSALRAEEAAGADITKR